MLSMMTSSNDNIPRYWSFVRGIHRSPMNSLHKGQWRGALMFSLICAPINGWVNNREAGDLRRHRAHYDVIVMHQLQLPFEPDNHTGILICDAIMISINSCWPMGFLIAIFPLWLFIKCILIKHYSEIIMSAMTSQITGVSSVCSNGC